MAVNDIHSMSDEDFMNSYPEQFEEEAVAPTSQETTEVVHEQEQEEVFETDEPSEQFEEEAQASDDELESEGEEVAEDSQVEEEVEEVQDGTNYQAEYEKLLSPFKANGTEIQVKNVDEAVKLMQMGANYTKKMSALKPNLKLMKMLENNSLLDESKLSLLIDVASGKPEAIARLVKDKGIDPLDLNTEDNQYTPSNHTVGDNEVELDDVIDRLRDSPSFSDTMTIVTSKWDQASKSSIAGNPQWLEQLDMQVSNGVYAKVNAEVQKQRMFGNLSGLSDLEAYLRVGSHLEQTGALATPKPQTVTAAPTRKPVNQGAKRAATPSKSALKAIPKEQFDPLAMSDEDFEKLIN